MSSLTELAKQILAAAETIDQYIEKNDLPKPSFEVDAPPALPRAPEVQGAAIALEDALLQLRLLAGGPSHLYVHHLMGSLYDAATLQVLNEFKFWDAVPLHGTATYAQIATKTGLPEEGVRRLLRHAFTSKIFADAPAGSDTVKHTMMSAAFIHDPKLRSWVGHLTMDLFPVVANFAETLKWSGGNIQDPEKTSTALLNFRDHPKVKSFWEWISLPEESWRAERFAEAMAWVAGDPGLSINAIHEMFDWASLGDATLVDVGGSSGQISVELAKAYPKMKFVVQDFANLQEPFNALVPADLKDRIKFQTHDFFTRQPVEGADVYFTKQIVHDWSDKYASKIIQNIVPAMEKKPGSRLMFMDMVVPPSGAAPSSIARLLATADMVMLVGLAGKERSYEDFIALLKMADERLELVEVHQIVGAPLALVEARLKL